MMIRSNPPGAVAYVDDYEIGTTPASTDFTYYGTRKIRIVKDGYETLTVMQPVPAPWYQIPPLDFVFENLVPGEVRDQRTFMYQLVPQMVVPTDQLLGRGESLRSRAHSSGFVRVSPSGPGTLGPPPAAEGYHWPVAGETHPLPSSQPGGAVPIHTLPLGGRPTPGGP